MDAPMIAFIEDSYQESLTLITELRDYLSGLQAGAADANGSDADEQDPQVKIRVIGEISSMTRHMTEAMAWLLLQKAAAAGEITADEAQTRADGLLVEDEAPKPTAPGAEVLPIEVRGYMDRSRRLYDQIQRLRGTLQKTSG